MKTLLEHLQAAAAYLARHGSESPRTDAEWLIAHALEVERLELYLQHDRPLGEAELDRIRPLLKRRAGGEPVQYLTGSTAFYNCDLLVGPGVLIPRPETERLVELALEAHPGSGPVLDLCTGSGAVLLALAQERPQLEALTGIDISGDALVWAERNRRQLGEERVRFIEGDLFAPVAGQTFALITANPPYVSEAEFEALPGHIREHEPPAALLAGADGLDVLRRLAEEGRAYLVPDGWLLAEIGETQGPRAQELFEAQGWRQVRIEQDYTQRDRVLLARRLGHLRTSRASTSTWGVWGNKSMACNWRRS